MCRTDWWRRVSHEGKIRSFEVDCDHQLPASLWLNEKDRPLLTGTAKAYAMLILHFVSSLLFFFGKPTTEKSLHRGIFIFETVYNLVSKSV